LSPKSSAHASSMLNSCPVATYDDGVGLPPMDQVAELLLLQLYSGRKITQSPAFPIGVMIKAKSKHMVRTDKILSPAYRWIDLGKSFLDLVSAESIGRVIDRNLLAIWA
jgi:hypothetical protein